MSEVALPNLPMQARVVGDALEVEASISFNTWRALGERLCATESVTQWWLGDWWLIGRDRFGLDYIPALDQISARYPTLVGYARVARAFPQRSESEGLSSDARPSAYRVQGVSFVHHRICSGIPDDETRMAWIGDVLRHGWSSRQLEAELAAWIASSRPAMVRERPLAIRATGEIALRCQVRADALGVDVKDLALAVLDLASQLEDPIGALEAAGAVMSELEAA